MAPVASACMREVRRLPKPNHKARLEKTPVPSSVAEERKCSVHAREDSLKKGERQVARSPSNPEVSGTLLWRSMPIELHQPVGAHADGE